MTNATRRTAKFIATIWPAGTTGEWGQEVPGVPYTVLCSYLEGGNRTATTIDGTKFQPRLVIWYEETETQPQPDQQKECYVVIGDKTQYSSPSEAGAFIVKSNSLQPWINNSQRPDVELAC